MKRTRFSTNPAMLQLAGRELPAVNFWAVLDFLTSGEVAGAFVASKGMKAAVERYMQGHCERADIGGPGYSTDWKSEASETAHSVCRLARRLRVLQVTDSHCREGRLAQLVRANSLTLRRFESTADMPASVLFALARCSRLETLWLRDIVWEDERYEREAVLTALAEGVGKYLRELNWELSNTEAQLLFEFLEAADFPALQTLGGCAPEDWSLLESFPTLTVLSLDCGWTGGWLCDLVGFATAIAKLPRLKDLWIREAGLGWDFGDVRALKPDLVWTLPELEELCLLAGEYVQPLPPLRAVSLKVLATYVHSDELLELMEGCPNLVKVGVTPGSPEDPHDREQLHMPQEYVQTLAARIRTSASAAAAGDSKACQWSRTLETLGCERPALPAEVLSAIGNSWKALTDLSFVVFSGTPALLTRFLLESLPRLTELTIRLADTDATEEETVSPFELDFTPSSEAKTLPQLRSLTATVEAPTLTGFSLPSLTRLQMEEGDISGLDVTALLPSAPKLSTLQFSRNEGVPAVGSSSSDARPPPRGCRTLLLNLCHDIEPEQLRSLLLLLPSLSEVAIWRCGLLPPEVVLQDLAARTPPLSELSFLSLSGGVSGATRSNAIVLHPLVEAVMQRHPQLSWVCVNGERLSNCEQAGGP